MIFDMRSKLESSQAQPKSRRTSKQANAEFELGITDLNTRMAEVASKNDTYEARFDGLETKISDLSNSMEEIKALLSARGPENNK